MTGSVPMHASTTLLQESVLRMEKWEDNFSEKKKMMSTKGKWLIHIGPCSQSEEMKQKNHSIDLWPFCAFGEITNEPMERKKRIAKTLRMNSNCFINRSTECREFREGKKNEWKQEKHNLLGTLGTAGRFYGWPSTFTWLVSLGDRFEHECNTN